MSETYPVAHTHLELQFLDFLGHAHRVRVVVADGHGWHLHVTINGAPFSKRCHDWQAVERTMAWLRRHAHEPLPIDAPAPADARPWLAAAAAVLLLVTGAAVSVAQEILPSSPAVAAFSEATRDYARMHRRLEAIVGPITLDSSIEAINRSIVGLAAAIRAERAGAKQGDLFTPALARELRIRVNDALFEHGFTAADVIRSASFEGIDPATVRLSVNGTFPWLLATAMFPCVIQALPPLPPELQYRIVGNDLVLIDIHASLIVDILPNVLADMTARHWGHEGERP